MALNLDVINYFKNKIAVLVPFWDVTYIAASNTEPWAGVVETILRLNSGGHLTDRASSAISKYIKNQLGEDN